MALGRLTFTRSRRGRRRYWIAGGLVILVALGIGTCRIVKNGKAAPTFREHLVAKGDLRSAINAAADVSPQNRIELRPPVAGRIDQVLVREGDFIKKGQVLAWISSTDRASLLDAARAKGPEEVARWEDAYKPTPLVAPLSGFIIARRAEPGQNIGSSEAPLVMADRLIVRAQVDETDLGKIRIGQKAEVLLDAYPDIRLPGRVDHIAYEAKSANNVTVYDLEVELLKSSSVLRSGMTATVSVTIDERRGVILVPAEALTDEKGILSVLVKRDKRPPALRPVAIGMSDNGMVEIPSGLNAGTTILIASNAVPPSLAKTGKNPLMPQFGGRRR
ncbi:MAG: HlyD family efflux transporter periplasmic adaptor subunit [Elusimicrobia bacterium]|nr:HlyD family efflux transporter periplasmic adaptor subunit [Elusimicrobiota bacterium]